MVFKAEVESLSVIHLSLISQVESLLDKIQFKASLCFIHRV